MWYAKMYFSEKKEVFQFDSHGVQGVPSTYEEFPFLESLLSFLEADCKELEPLLRRAYENWSLLIDRDDRDAGVRTLMDLGDLGSRHIYLHLLYVRWFERFGRMGITQDRGSREDQEMLEELQASRNSSRCISSRYSVSLISFWMWTRRGGIPSSRHRPTISTMRPRTRLCSPSGPSPSALNRWSRAGARRSCIPSTFRT